MSEYVTIEVHNEFARRIDEENTRQNHRLSELEQTVKEINRLTVSVEKMATSMASMTEELKSQGKKLEQIEQEPADKWKNAVWIVISAVIAAGVGALLGGLI